MYEGHTVAVVIPAYNEEGFVGSVIGDIPHFVDNIYVIDDASTDGTWSEILDYVETEDSNDVETTSGREVPARADGGHVTDRVVALRHDRNRGVGAAIETGYRLAREQEVDVTAVINGDGQMDPSILDRFLDPIVEGEADYTKGNRIQSPDLFSEMSRWRLFGNVVLTFLTKVASGYRKTNDSQNGYTAVSLEVLQAVDLDALYDRYGFLNDFLIRLNCHGFRVADVPMKARYGEEVSHIRYRTFVPRVSALLLRGFLRRLGVKYFVLDFHPLVLLYLLGAVGTLAGVAFGTLLFVNGGSMLALGTAFLIVLVSTALCVSAMALDMQYNETVETNVHY